MQKNVIKNWLSSSYLTGSNRSYIEQLYDLYLKNPDSVGEDWKLRFRHFATEDIKNKLGFVKSNLELDSGTVGNMSNDFVGNLAVNADFKLNHEYIKLFKLVNDFRSYGHKFANLDPLNLWRQKSSNDLCLQNYGFFDSDFQKVFDVDLFNVPFKNISLLDLYNFLKQTYCGSIGVEYMHVSDTDHIYWIQHYIENLNKDLSFDNIEKKRLLAELVAAEGIECYLGIKFPAAKRFSLEGCDVLIPMLKEMIRQASIHGVKEILMGMAHRGRLNVLVNIFGKNPKKLFDEFLDNDSYKDFGSGDVKYHKGFSSELEVEGNLINLSLMFNPSHLEIINPIVMGAVRARLDEKIKNENMILPVLLHGDASISGQGIVQETFNMSKVRAYCVGGSIHIIINNQIGFTTSNLKDIRSTEYCTDIAKMLHIPIFHVNADDPEAVMQVIIVALKFRNAFKQDVVIDLVCYRRHGHNEADDPSVTQPLMYQKIHQHSSISQIYSNKLKQDEVIEVNDITNMINEFKKKLDQGDCVLQECKNVNVESATSECISDRSSCVSYPNKIDIDYLQKLSYLINDVPDKIVMHPRVSKIYSDRISMSQGIKFFDWGGAEMLAYATILDQGISVRLSGEDTARGTFFHRHAVIHDQKNGEFYIPLQHIGNHQGVYYVWDSVLSEEATLAFEYGYANKSKYTLVIWEAQFGDFSNGAQIVIDQFISSGEQKWGRLSGLVMLLPHGYEGQGPEHSSARLERYLQLCAENNLQICIPSTAGQFYHMLRRQAICNVQKPLIVMSPKSLLRRSASFTPIKELAYGTFKTVIEELDKNINICFVICVIICTGKIYYDLLDQRCKNRQCNVAILRIEQLYPFPFEELKNLLLSYSNYIKKIIWCQEEPENQGAWYYCQRFLRMIVPKNISLSYVGREASAAPAVGSLSVHQKQQKKIIDNALSID
ncbi:2-oxoglutarate dehydrogenase E1 component [Blochmannia endosymbiont of Colobopsis nipponica]|uniref:2-oxoglutarate dehydrogenase E1 component n=1 Tax=Blochmannia endosymbiont of Colobopsis nipponica TaxID=2681987 RepID=UPI0017832C85|nr:2-oxoglutarate dehydrogenase E1 component [Blochmannia endosymbiont of Colobopsis nipponica]QOI11113.1 2-oxoglutarate dehydrogenase E1 component [Blochmannia endosymbiont of Colobopsis nipponica]